MALEEIKNFVTVGPLLATAGQPSEARIGELAAAGYEVVVNLGLLDPRYCLEDEAASVARAGMAYHHIPVVFGEPRSGDFERFVTVMDENASRRTFVHCAMNWRVSSFVALYGQLRWGWSVDEADAHLRKVWQPDEVWTRFIAERRALFAEHALPAGRITAGVVRVGDTVRRPAKPSSAFVGALLGRLAAAGCAWAPRYLGTDAQGRDMLSYAPGFVPPKWVTFSDAQIRAAAAIVRELHDVTRDERGTVICHHDAGPNNFVFRDELPVALIDFDMAAPGEALEDVGYMAWSWCLSSKPTRGSPAEQARQVRVLADAYGLEAAQRGKLFDQIIARLERNVRFWSTPQPDDTLTTPARAVEMVEWSERERRYIEAHRATLIAALE